MNSSNDTYNWYAIKSVPHKEKLVVEELNFRGFSNYLPLVIKHTSTGKKREIPLFTGYIFVHASIKDFEKLRYIPGTKGLVHINQAPCVIKDSEIEFLKIICSDIRYKAETKPYKVGDSIKILDGPFKGMHAVISLNNHNKMGLEIGECLFRVWIDINKTVFERTNLLNK